jgi:hypothetical protein
VSIAVDGGIIGIEEMKSILISQVSNKGATIDFSYLTEGIWS